MKLLVKLQSYSDIITNSSSEMFIVRKGDEEEGSIQYLNKEWLDHYWYIYWEIVCKVAKIPTDNFGYEDPKYGVWTLYDRDYWESYIKEHKKEILNELSKYVLVEVSDHDYSWDIFEALCDDYEDIAIYHEIWR